MYPQRVKPSDLSTSRTAILAPSTPPVDRQGRATAPERGETGRDRRLPNGCCAHPARLPEFFVRSHGSDSSFQRHPTDRSLERQGLGWIRKSGSPGARKGAECQGKYEITRSCVAAAEGGRGLVATVTARTMATATVTTTATASATTTAA